MFRLFFFLAILSTGQLYAQEIDWTVDTVDVVLELYGAEDGLSQSFVTAIVQDSSGYIWVGTKDGLNRFDGRTFKVYRSDENNENSLNGNYIVDLLIDKEQRLWVSTEDSGLYFYDSTEDGFTEVHSVNGERIDAPGYLWQPDSALVATSKVHPERSFVLFESPLFGESNHTLKSFVSSFKGASEIVARIKEIENYQRKSSERFPILNSWGDIYFKEDENTISQYALTDGNKYTKRIRKVPKGYILTDYTEVFDNPRSRNVFVTSAEKGFNAKILHLSSVRGDTFDECFSLPSKTGSAEHNEYYYANDSCIIQTSSYKNEIAFIDLPSNKLTVYKSQSSVTGLNAFLLDKDGNLWLRYNPGGLAKLSKNHRKFQRKPSKRRGASWSARFESENQKALYSEFLKDEFEYPSNQLLKEYQKRSLSGYHNVAYADSKNRFWCLFHVFNIPDEETPEISISLKDLIPHLEFIDFILPWNGDTVQIIDRNRGEYRILEFQLDQGVINTISLPQLKGHYPELFVLDYLTKYPEKIYLATKEGLFIYNQEIEDWKVYSVESGHLKNQPVFSICEDPHDPEILWLGTGSGLHRFNTSTEEVVVFTEKEGLPNDFVYSIQSDDFGNLWIGTNYGLARYNIKADKFRAFNRSDGINGDEFNTFEYSKSPDGTMCFGGIEGNTAFHPKEFLSDSVRSNVVINQIRLFNRLVEHASTDASSEIFTLPHPPELTKEIELTHEESMLTIAFGMIDFGQWERQVYRYRMQGLDDQWIETKEIREATFTNLDAGNYTFEVVGKNSQGNWSLEPTTLKITILPAWWETWWFRSSIGLLLLVIGYVVYKYRLNAILKVERTRNQIAQDLHDEIGSTLSSISLYGAVMKSNEKELSEQNRPILDRIITNVSDIMEKMNDMVWTIKTDNDHMDQVINRMRAFAVEMTEAKDIELHFDVDRSVEQLKLEMDKRKEIYLIFKEVVNNSVKYSQAQHIKIELNEQAKKLTLSIQDDGIGFDPDVKKVNMLGGNGIPGMKRRAERIDAVLSFESEIGIGTKVALSMKLNH